MKDSFSVKEAQEKLNALYVKIEKLSSRISSSNFISDMHQGAISSGNNRHPGWDMDGLGAASEARRLQRVEEKLKEHRVELEKKLVEKGRKNFEIRYRVLIETSDNGTTEQLRSRQVVSKSIADASVTVKRQLESVWSSYNFLIDNGLPLSKADLSRLRAAGIETSKSQEAESIKIINAKLVD